MQVTTHEGGPKLLCFINRLNHSKIPMKGEKIHVTLISLLPLEKNEFRMGKSGTINLKLVMRGEKRMNDQYLPSLLFY